MTRLRIRDQLVAEFYRRKHNQPGWHGPRQLFLWGVQEHVLEVLEAEIHDLNYER